MSAPRVVICEFMDAAAVQQLHGEFDVLYAPELVDDPQALHAALADALALIVRNRTQVRGSLLEHAPRLRVVGRLGVGLDNIDLPACKARGIDVIPALGANAQAVAEYVVGTAMLLLRGLRGSSDEVAAGAWPRPRMSDGREVGGKTLGLLGFGDIGRRTARLAQAVGMRVLAHDPMLDAASPLWAQADVGCRSLDDLLGESDVLSLHVPLTPATRGLLDAARLARMREGSVLINTARGGVVDETALARALRDGHLAGAALDVFEHEPLPAGSVLAGVPNLLLTPHIAGVTRESNVRVSSLIADKVGAALRQAA